MYDVAAIRDLAVEIATGAGQMLDDALHGQRTVSTKSSATDMLTEMDGRSERYVVDHIVRSRPDDAVLGEEGASRDGTTGLRWVIDPIDGTTNYLYRFPGWAVSIGVELDGDPVAGAIVVPATGETFAAAKGLGATRNGTSLAQGTAPPLSTALVGTGFNYDPDVRRRQAEALVHIVPRVRDIRRMGAAAPDLCSVATGRLDAYYEAGLGHWDRSAGTIIATEAGARVGLLDALEAPGPLVVAANPGIYDDLVGLLIDAGLTSGWATD